MILWTIQTRECWDRALKRGFLKANKKFVWHSFKKPYIWMQQQMIRHIGSSTNGILWAWYHYNKEHKKPDLRSNAHLPKGEKGIRIKFKTDLALLSDFDKWHCVLNNWYVGNSKTFEKELFHHAKSRDYPVYIQREIEKSWDNIFILSKAKSIQATLWRINLRDILEVKDFIAR